MKTSAKKSIAEKKKSEKKDRMMVLLEDIKGQVTAVAEGHSVLENKLDKLDSKVDGLGTRLDKVEGRMDGMESRMGSMESRMDGLEKKMDEGFQLVLDHLDGLDREFTELKNELKNNYERKGHDIKWRKAIEERLERLEKMLIVRKTARS